MKRSLVMGFALFLSAPISIFAQEAAEKQADEPVPLEERPFRVIRGTESPNGRFALGVGRITERAEKGKSRLLSDDSSWNAGVSDTGDESIINYVVDLREQVILAETGLGYVSNEPDYNRSTCRAYWSPDNRTVVQVDTFQRRYGRAALMRVDPDRRRVSEPFDLGTAAEECAMAFLKKQHHRAWSEEKDFAVQPLLVALTNDIVALTVWGEIVHSRKPDDQWAVRVKMRIAMSDEFEVRGETISAGSPTEEDWIDPKLTDQSPDKKYAVQKVFKPTHQPWSAHPIHRLELVSCGDRKVVAQLLPAVAPDATYDQPLLWSPDSKWCAFHPGGGGEYSVVFRKAGGKFVAANQPKQLRVDAVIGKARLHAEDVAPVRWKEPGILILKQTSKIVPDNGDPFEVLWELEAAYDEKKKTMTVVREKKLSAEETGKLGKEIQARSTPE